MPTIKSVKRIYQPAIIVPCDFCGSDITRAISMMSSRNFCDRDCLNQFLRKSKDALGLGALFEDLSGRRFGRLVVRKQSDLNKRKRNRLDERHWECVCDCGGQSVAATRDLVRGLCKSCGCGHQNGRLHLSWKGCGDISGHFWSMIRRNALNRGLEFSITVQCGWSIFEKQNGKCALSGVAITFGDPSLGKDAARKAKTASLDRIDSTMGYVDGNVQWVDRDINFMKGSMLQDTFLEFCSLIASRHPSSFDINSPPRLVRDTRRADALRAVLAG